MFRRTLSVLILPFFAAWTAAVRAQPAEPVPAGGGVRCEGEPDALATGCIPVGSRLRLAWSDPAARPKPLDRYEFLQVEMGVPFRIVLYADDQAVANKAARAAYRRIDELEDIMSDYDPDSELMRLCRESAPGRPVQVSPELFEVLRYSKRLSRKTGGAFDVTIGPVVRLWRIARRRKKLPGQDALKEALRRTGYKNVKLDRKARTVELLKEDMRLDLGGIAKGYAGDEALKTLQKYGISRALIDGSGDIVVGDPPPGRDGWKIAVEGLKPVASRRDTTAVEGLRRPSEPPSRDKPAGSRPPLAVSLKNAAVATSGDAYNYVEFDGKRYSHIVDPTTGLGLTVPSSVTVIAPDGKTADSLASALNVLGPRRGLKLIEARAGTAALIAWLQDGKVQRHVSCTFSEYTDAAAQ